MTWHPRPTDQFDTPTEAELSCRGKCRRCGGLFYPTDPDDPNSDVACESCGVLMPCETCDGNGHYTDHVPDHHSSDGVREVQIACECKAGARWADLQAQIEAGPDDN